MQLPKESINLNYQDANGYSALHYSSELGNIKIVEMLIKAKCNINIKTKENKTPLHLSAIKGKYDIFKFLIENNADINVYDSEHNSPLHYICLYNHLNLLKFILEKNPDIETKNSNGKKPSELTSNKEMISLLEDYQNHKNNSNNDSSNIEDNLIINNNIKKNYYNGIPKIYIKEKKSSELSEKYRKIKIDNKINEKNENKTTREYHKKENMINSSKQVNNYFRESKDNNINNQSYLKSNLKVMKALFNNSNNVDLNKSNKVENLMNISKQNIALNKPNLNLDNSHNIKKKKLRQKKDILSSNIVNTYFTEEDQIQTSNIIKHHSKDKIARESTKTVHFNLITNIMSKKTKENPDIYDKINHKKSKEKSKENPKSNSNKSKKNKSNKKINQNQKVKNTSRNIELLSGLRPHNSTQGLSYFVDNTLKANHKDNHLEPKTSKNLNKITEERISLSSFVSLAILGRGSFGEVYLVQKIDTKKKYAMKVLNKDRILAQNLLKYVKAERNILSIMNHPFIIKLYYAFQTNSKLFLILEYCPGGDLSKHLYFEKKFSEPRAKIYICEVLLALENLHKNNIIYRDLKPDNVVLCDDGHCKLTDFGLSKEGVFDGNAAKSFCGSIAYLAPEMLQKKGHGKAVDWYLLGVLLYEMIIGVTPFFSNSKEEIFYNIENEKLVIPDYVSKEAADLIRKLLERNPSKRLGSSPSDAEEIKKEAFFKDINWNDVYNKTIKAPFKNNYNFSSIHYFKSPKLFVKDNVDKLSANYIEDWSFVDESET
jgi:ankyrin repeat protein